MQVNNWTQVDGELTAIVYNVFISEREKWVKVASSD